MLLINLIFTELFICLFGIPMDLVATVHGGWWMGEGLCVATGFILTLLGIVQEGAEKNGPLPSLSQSNHTSTVKFFIYTTLSFSFACPTRDSWFWFRSFGVWLEENYKTNSAPLVNKPQSVTQMEYILFNLYQTVLLLITVEARVGKSGEHWCKKKVSAKSLAFHFHNIQVCRIEENFSHQNHMNFFWSETRFTKFSIFLTLVEAWVNCFPDFRKVESAVTLKNQHIAALHQLGGWRLHQAKSPRATH